MLQRQFLIFCIAGGLGFLVDVGVLYALAPWLGWHSGRIASFCAAATFTWWFNRRWTFGAAAASGARSGRQYLLYLIAMAGGAFINLAVYALVLERWPGPAPGVAGVAFGSLAGLLLNFSAARHLLGGKAARKRT